MFSASRAYVALLVAFVGAPLAAQRPSGSLDSLVAREMRTQHVVGASVLVMQGDKVLLHKGYGVADKATGTPATPEPIASRLHFYTDDELQQLGRDAGFAGAQVVRRDLEPFAREAGVPEAHLGLFKGPGGPFLIARKS